MKNMNLPNKLTIARIIATPVFLFFLLCDFPFHYFLAMLIFIAAALTDLFDGKYARKHNLVTDFGIYRFSCEKYRRRCGMDTFYRAVP